MATSGVSNPPQDQSECTGTGVHPGVGFDQSESTVSQGVTTQENFPAVNVSDQSDREDVCASQSEHRMCARSWEVGERVNQNEE